MSGGGGGKGRRGKGGGEGGERKGGATPTPYYDCTREGKKSSSVGVKPVAEDRDEVDDKDNSFTKVASKLGVKVTLCEDDFKKSPVVKVVFPCLLTKLDLYTRRSLSIEKAKKYYQSASE